MGSGGKKDQEGSKGAGEMALLFPAPLQAELLTTTYNFSRSNTLLTLQAPAHMRACARTHILKIFLILKNKGYVFKKIL